MYIVKSVNVMLDHVEKGNEVSYGKQLTFVHRPEAFEPTSRRLL